MNDKEKILISRIDVVADFARAIKVCGVTSTNDFVLRGKYPLSTLESIKQTLEENGWKTDWTTLHKAVFTLQIRIVV